MSAHILSRSAVGISAAVVMLMGCGGGGGGSISAGPSLPVAAQFTLTIENSVVVGSTPSSISFSVQDATRNCIQFPEPFSDNHLAYNDSAARTVQLVDCGSTGWFNVKFHALDVNVADTIIKWTVAESGLTEAIVDQGGLCVTHISGQERVTAKSSGGC